MNVDEVLKYEAVKDLNLKLKSSQAPADFPPKKKQKSSNESASTASSSSMAASLSHLSDKEKLDVLRMLENEPEAEPFDESSLKRLLNQVEKKVSKNQEMRIKFADQPERFMDSEVELNEILQEMHVLSTRPDLYIMLIDSNTVPLLLNLLSHDNIDICASVVSLLQELTDIDASEDSLENIRALVDLLCEQQIFQLLVSILERLDEKNKDEAEAVHNALSIVENIIEMKPSLSLDSSKQSLMQWLLRRIKTRGVFDNNKLYAAEILSILVQNMDDNRRLLGDMGGIDILLQQIAYYKKHNPASAEEHEYMENLFNCMCSCLMLPANRLMFLKGEGLQLMRLILREQKNARNSALKVLSYAMNNLEGKENCQAFVEMLGLTIIFPLFMKPVTASKKKKSESLNNEEHLVSIIASLLKNCSTANKSRVISKFLENDHEKVDRLLELYFKYYEQVEQVERSDNDDDEDDDDMDEDELESEFYMKKLDNGLFALQSIVFIILDITVNGAASIRNRVTKLLNLRSVPKERLIDIIKEYMQNLGDDETKTATVNQEETSRIQELIQKF